MATRLRVHDLARLLDRSERPIYAVDEQLRIVFLNEAAAAWAGVSAEELVGQTCKYHSGPEATAAAEAACRLCPPPVVMTGVETTAEIVLPSGDDAPQRRQVQFVPITAAQDVIGVLAVAGEPLAAAAADSPLDDAHASADLHRRVALLRHAFRQRYHIDRLLGQTPAMLRVREQVLLAARSPSHVLVIGRPGSGREHVARAIHAADTQRSTEPLVPLACSLVGGELLRSTVAALLQQDSPAARMSAEAAARQAWSGPTLLLNDIDQLPPLYQADLPSLIAAASGKVRIIATARESLVAKAQRGEFLTLAAHQLSTIVIELPPLAQRLADLPLLAQAFLEQVNAHGSKQVGSFTDDALDLLAAYPWTRDLDELEEMVREAHRLAQGPQITPADLPEAVRHARVAAVLPNKQEQTINLEEFLGRIELELIQRALSQAKGNKTKAAQLLGLNRPRLYRRLVQLGLVDASESAEAADAGEAIELVEIPTEEE